MATKKTGTQVAKWDEELARQAELAAKMEANAGGGQFFTTKGGVLAWQDAPMPGNQMAVVILDHIMENVYYEGAFDPDNPSSPTCFAFGRDDAKMTPHQTVVDAGNAQYGAAKLCQGCPMNEFGTAIVGKGKACKNTRRLAMIPAGQFDQRGRFQLTNDEEHFETTTVGFMKLPVTSVKGYAGFVKQVAGALRRPPHGIITKVHVKPDPKNQYVVLFEPIQNVPDNLMAAVMKRHEEVKSVIEFPYQLGDGEEKPKKPAKKGRKY